MTASIRRFTSSDTDAVDQITSLAWEPVFAAWERILGPELVPIAISPDPRQSQRELAKRLCHDEENVAWVSEVEGRVVAFVAYSLNGDTETGEVRILAVHPEYQNRGIGTDLNNFALQKMREAGMKLAEVGTGGDDGHAPARRCYEKAGYTGLPLVRYYQAL